MAKKLFDAKKTGEWNKALQTLLSIDKAAEGAGKAVLMQVTLKGESIVKKHIANQDLKWRSLNKKYLKSKIKAGQSEKKLVATATYFQAITRFVSGNYGYIGVRRGVMTDDGDEELANIAMIHEFGSLKRNIKPRPLWRPSMKELKAWVKGSGLFPIEMKKRL